MAKVLVTESYLSGIANAIRGKNGQATTYKPSEMAAAIANIPTGITPTGTINITQNGTVDVTDYASANVSVPGGGGSSLPDVRAAYFMNGGNISNTISHTFDAGTYQVLIVTTNGKTISGLTVLLNGVDITENVNEVLSSGQNISVYSYSDTFSANDVISVSMKSATENTGVQMFIFKNLTLLSVSLLGFRGNGDGTFNIPASTTYMYFEVAKFGYYNESNTIPAVLLMRALTDVASIETPNTSTYYAGGTYVLQIAA